MPRKGVGVIGMRMSEGDSLAALCMVSVTFSCTCCCLHCDAMQVMWAISAALCMIHWQQVCTCLQILALSSNDPGFKLAS